MMALEKQPLDIIRQLQDRMDTELDLTIVRTLSIVHKRLQEFRGDRRTGKVTIIIRDGKALTVQQEYSELVEPKSDAG